MSAPGNFDYVIIGAGSAGCVMANRLSADPDVRVLLLEAGGRDRDVRIKVPLTYAALFGSSYDWQFETVAQSRLGGRRVQWPRGKTLGGSSAINAMIYLRGHPGDYDGWSADGAEGWGWEEVLPYFRKLESAQEGRGGDRGTHGPLQLSNLRAPQELSARFVDAAVATGLLRTEDLNAGTQDRAGLFEVTQRNGRRHSAADAYLHPIEERANLEVVTDATVTRIRFAGARASGATYRKDGTETEVDSRREVICSAGAVGSPQLLMVSGVGPGEHLSNHGISVVADSGSVGGNLHDHPLVGVNYHATQPVTLSTADNPWNLVRHLVRYLLTKSGPLSSSGPEAGALVRGDPSRDRPDLVIAFAPAFLDISTLDRPEGHGFAVVVGLLDPNSRGRLTLASADPTDPPLIDPNYLDDPSDLSRLIQGLELADDIVHTPPLDRYCDDAASPWTGTPTDEQLADHIRSSVGTFHHPVGTCRMGTDDHAVVDPHLKVRGVEDLRVVDASVMPRVPTGGPNATTIMIAEKAADHILNGD